MVEEIEKVAERGILLAHPLDEQLRVVPGEYAGRAREPHKRHGHLGRPARIRRPGNFVDLAGREAQGGVGPEADDFLGGLRLPAHGALLREKALEHTDGLKEVKPIPLLEEGVR
jgi:hypothetical protein